MSHRLDNALFGAVVLLVCGANEVAVALIFAIFGYNLACKMQEEEKHNRRGRRYKDWRPWWRAEVRSAVSVLLLPFFIWNVAAFVVQLALGNLHAGDVRAWLALSGLDLTQPTFLPNLWITRNLFFLVVISPIFSILVRKIRWALVLATGAFFFSWQICRATLDPAVNNLLTYGCSLIGLAAFTLGVLLRREHLHFSKKFACYIALALAVFFWYAPDHPPFASIRQLAKVAKIAFLPLLCYGLWGLTPAKRLPSALLRSTSAIFFLHGIFLAIYGTLLASPDASILDRVLSTAAALVLSFLVHRMLQPFPQLTKRIFPMQSSDSEPSPSKLP